DREGTIMKKFFSIMLLIFGMVGANTAHAVFVFQANLTNDQETPPTPPEGSSGTALFVLNDARTRLTYDVQLSGLDLRGVSATGPTKGTPGLVIPGDLNPNDNVTRMHIHRAAFGIAGNIVFGMIDASADLRNDFNDL